MYNLWYTLPRYIDGEVSPLGYFIDFIDASDTLELASSRTSVDALAVIELAVFLGSGDMHCVEVASGSCSVDDSVSDRVPTRILRGNGRGDHSSAGACQFRCDKGKTLQVL